MTVSVKNASRPEVDSMANACVTEAFLTAKDGKYRVTLNLTSIQRDLGSVTLTGWASDWKIYQENSYTGSTVNATVTKTKTVKDASGKDTQKPTQIQFDLPDGAVGWGGVYVNMYVDAMESSPDAWLALDFDHLTAVKTDGNTTSVTGKTTTTIRGITYKATGKTAQVTKVSKNIKKASVAATVKIGSKTYKVTSIKAKAFKGRNKLTTVTIGKNVKTVGTSAFQGDKKLKTVTIGKSVKTIGAKAFCGDKKLAKITFKGKTVKKIGKNAFKGIAKNAAFKAPKAKKKAYKKMIKKAGAPKGFKVK